MKLVTTITLVEEVSEAERDLMRQSFENGDIMEEARVRAIESFSLQEHDEVRVSFDIWDDEEEEDE